MVVVKFFLFVGLKTSVSVYFYFLTKLYSIFFDLFLLLKV